MSIFLVLGTRPQIIKSTPIINESIKQNLPMQIIHTGQHYDPLLSQVFFNQLSTAEPFANLNVGSGSHIYQLSEIMIRLEKLILSEKPSCVLVPGDTNSALAGALASVKLGVSLAHLESGARSYDMKMAEEINRRLIDHCSEILFTPTNKCTKNLEAESVTGEILQAGDTMYDVFVSSQGRVDDSNIVDSLGLRNKEYAVFTTHRAENVDDPKKLNDMLETIANANIPVVFPIHPRTRDSLKQISISFKGTNVQTIDPVGYLEMLALLKHAKIVITDSGGLQKEAFWSKTPCITIRDRTEWIETVDLGVNFVTDMNPSNIKKAMDLISKNYRAICKGFKCNPYGDGKASERIVKFLKQRIES